MSEKAPSRHLGRKLWCGITIGLCVLVLLLSAVGILGTCVAARALGDVAVSALGVVEQVAGSVQTVLQRIDQPLAQMYETSTSIAGATARIGQNVADTGLMRTLLPEEQEQRLVELGGTVQDTVGGARDTLAAAMELYRTIDRLPFVSLPQPIQEGVAAMEASAAETRAAAEQVRQDIQDFRSGAADRIGRVQAGASQVAQNVDGQRQRIAALDADMVALQELALGLQGKAQTSLTVIAVLVSLLLAFVLYTQVEVIRLCVRRWRQ